MGFLPEGCTHAKKPTLKMGRLSKPMAMGDGLVGELGPIEVAISPDEAHLRDGGLAWNPELEFDRNIGQFRENQSNALFRQVPDGASLRLVGRTGSDPPFKVGAVALTGSAFG
jgi:hypothetical protein